jgi:hypothetical protein
MPLALQFPQALLPVPALPENQQFGTSLSSAGVTGQSNYGAGVYGVSLGSPGQPGYADAESSNGVMGLGNNGVVGQGEANGVVGQSPDGIGVNGINMYGSNAGVYGQNGTEGVGFSSDRVAGVVGASIENTGVVGLSENLDGVRGISNAQQHAGVAAINIAPSSGNTPSGFGLYAASNSTGIYASGSPAGYFAGDVQVTGDVILVNSSGDVAEDFDVGGEAVCQEPGTVLVINPDGRLGVSTSPYDTCVAGVVAGAGELKPAIVLQRIESDRIRAPIALIGKAFCKVDASFGRIQAGDLLTTSVTPGHAMKVADTARAVGAIIGKALTSLDAGIGLIPILLSPR